MTGKMRGCWVTLKSSFRGNRRGPAIASARLTVRDFCPPSAGRGTTGADGSAGCFSATSPPRRCPAHGGLDRVHLWPERDSGLWLHHSRVAVAFGAGGHAGLQERRRRRDRPLPLRQLALPTAARRPTHSVHSWDVLDASLGRADGHRDDPSQRPGEALLLRLPRLRIVGHHHLRPARARPALHPAPAPARRPIPVVRDLRLCGRWHGLRGQTRALFELRAGRRDLLQRPLRPRLSEHQPPPRRRADSVSRRH